jgi:outer membrane protein OmpA-like peptidoglycan-associated protein
MKRAWVIAMTIGMMISSGCIASHKYVKNQVKTSTDQLSSQVNGRIDQTNGKVDTLDGELKETRDSVDLVNRKVAGVDERVSVVDSRVSTVDGRVSTVDTKVGRVDNKVTQVDERVTTLDKQTTQQLGTIKEEVNTVDEKTEQTTKNLNVLDEKFGNRNNLSVSAERMIQFAFDSSKLDKASLAQLDELASMVMDNRDAIIVLEGRTDNTGDRDYNLALGERRVEQVRRYLAVDKSIPVYRIHQVSFGAARPIAANDSAEGRQKNRSVMIMVLVPASTASAAASVRTGQIQ